MQSIDLHQFVQLPEPTLNCLEYVALFKDSAKDVNRHRGDVSCIAKQVVLVGRNSVARNAVIVESGLDLFELVEIVFDAHVLVVGDVDQSLVNGLDNPKSAMVMQERSLSWCPNHDQDGETPLRIRVDLPSGIPIHFRDQEPIGQELRMLCNSVLQHPSDTLDTILLNRQVHALDKFGDRKP